MAARVSRKQGRYDAVDIEGHRVAPLRVQCQLTQDELASAVGISRGYIARIEGSARFRVSRALATRLADALHITLIALENDEAGQAAAESDEDFDGSFGSHLRLGADQQPTAEPALSLELRRIIDQAGLPYAERHLATQLLLDEIQLQQQSIASKARLICQTLRRHADGEL